MELFRISRNEREGKREQIEMKKEKTKCGKINWKWESDRKRVGLILNVKREKERKIDNQREEIENKRIEERLNKKKNKQNERVGKREGNGNEEKVKKWKKQ